MMLRVKLSATQLDIDRAIGENKAVSGKTPAEFLSSALSALPALPWPSLIEMAADRATLAGQPLTALSASLEGTTHSWCVQKLAFDGPGDAHLALNGRTTRGKDGEDFSGPLDFRTGDAQGLRNGCSANPIARAGRERRFAARPRWHSAKTVLCSTGCNSISAATGFMDVLLAWTRRSMRPCVHRRRISMTWLA